MMKRKLAIIMTIVVITLVLNISSAFAACSSCGSTNGQPWCGGYFMSDYYPGTCTYYVNGTMMKCDLWLDYNQTIYHCYSCGSTEWIGNHHECTTHTKCGIGTHWICGY